MSASNTPRNQETMLAEVRRQVRDLLERTPAYRSLDPEKQRQIASDTVKVASYLSNPDGVLAPEFASSPRVQAPFPQEIRPVGERAAGLIQDVDFPGFVSSLIQGVFQAVVDASVRQMEAYADLIADAAKSVDQYLNDAPSDDDARDWLAQNYPGEIALDKRHHWPDFSPGASAQLTVSAADPGSFIRKVSTDLNLPGTLTDLNDAAQQRRLLQATRRKIAANRQQVLASMVLMGINRIVVTN